MAIDVYRIEDRLGNCPYFYRDGRGKYETLRGMKSADNGLCSFIDPKRFTEPSYINFLNDDDYILYKLSLTGYIRRSARGEVIFTEEHINNIEVCSKDICMRIKE